MTARQLPGPCDGNILTCLTLLRHSLWQRKEALTQSKLAFGFQSMSRLTASPLQYSVSFVCILHRFQLYTTVVLHIIYFK